MITVEGSSMEPAFHQGDRVAVRRTPGITVSTGDDVVVIERSAAFPGEHRRPAGAWDGRKWKIKRVGAVAGEPVPHGIPVPDAVVPAGRLVLLGDNAEAGFDSRAVGHFPVELVLGNVARRMR